MLFHGLEMLGRVAGAPDNAYRRFISFYGTDPLVVAILWLELQNWITQLNGCVLNHLFWSLYFLKNYGTEAQHAAVFHVDEKTLRKWVWFILKGMTTLRVQFVSSVVSDILTPPRNPPLTNFFSTCFCTQIRLGNRFMRDTHQRSALVVDGTDYRIFEPRALGFNPGWFSHKFRGPGVRWEVATCINTGWIVWIHGPFPCGTYSDLRIYRMALKTHLLPGERVVADGTYKDPTVILKQQARNPEHAREMALARSRHEIVNGRFKDFGALSQVFRHDRNKHRFVFTPIAVITQLEIMTGGAPFDITAQHNHALA